MKKMKNISIGLLVFGLTVGASAQELLTIGNFHYKGGFRIKAQKYGISDPNFNAGPISYNPDKGTMFIMSHVYQNSIGEFTIPELVKSSSIVDMNMTNTAIQPYSATPYSKVTWDDKEQIGRVGGFQYFRGPSGPELLVNNYEYYDAPGDNVYSAVRVRDANDIANSIVDGPLRFDARPGDTARWISPIPPEWRETLGGDYITGASAGDPIISRWSVGPTAFAFDHKDVVGNLSVPDPIPVNRLMSFSLGNPMPGTNLPGGNGAADAWTHLTRAAFAFIPPGTRTYVVLGGSGGHDSGIGYKIPDWEGGNCGGYCPYDPQDYYAYYWLFDVNDFIKVKNGELLPHLVEPYEHGKFPVPVEYTARSGFIGGTFDTESGTLYLTLGEADQLQGQYANPPVFLAYQFGAAPPPPSRPGTGGGSSGSNGTETQLKNLFNPAKETAQIHCDGTAEIRASNGEVVRSIPCGSNSIAEWDGKNAKGDIVASGIYTYHAFNERHKIAVIK